MCCKKEEWKEIIDYPGYHISNQGNVYSQFTGRNLSPQMNHKGYLRVWLIRNDKYRHMVFVHKLVLEQFREKRPTGKICRHYPDPCKTNNFLCNLLWGTPKENSFDRIKDNTNVEAKLNIEEVIEIKNRMILGESLIKLSNIYLISVPVLSNIKHNNIWKNIGPDVSKHLKSIPKWHKLSINEIIKIKYYLKHKIYNQSELGRLYNVDASMISKIKTGKHHSDVVIPKSFII